MNADALPLEVLACLALVAWLIWALVALHDVAGHVEMGCEVRPALLSGGGLGQTSGSESRQDTEIDNTPQHEESNSSADDPDDNGRERFIRHARSVHLTHDVPVQG